MFLRALALFLALVAGVAWGADPITVKDIRIEGIQRIEAGTVFNYLPVKVGDKVDDTKAADAIRALFATGFFSDVKISFDGDVLVVTVQERPAIFTIDINGAKDITKDSLKDALKTVGIAESRVYDKSLIDRAEKELKRQYLGRGRYSAQITTTVKPLERNRVAITFDIDEGEVARIREIRFHGNTVFSSDTLTDLMVLSTPGWLTWYNKNDQYSKQKLSSDLETLRSFYQNRGYLEFTVESTQVSITPDREGIYITVNLSEGQRYTVTDVSLELRAGEVTCLIGESGSGKSLTARALLGLLPTGLRCDAACLEFAGRDLRACTPREWASLRGASLALVLQDPRHALNPVLSVERQLDEILSLHGSLVRAQRRTRIAEMLEGVGLSPTARLLRAYPHQLSGGMGQRVMIAMMLINGPRLLIADEPTSALDAELRDQVLELIVKLVATRGMGLLLISHDLQSVARHCERALILYRGRIVDRCAAAALAQSTHPYTRTLWSCRPSAATFGTALPTLDRDTIEPVAGV